MATQNKSISFFNPLRRKNLGGAILGGLLLTACGTLDFKDAEPEKYMGFDCAELSLLADSYRADHTANLFGDNRTPDIDRAYGGSRKAPNDGAMTRETRSEDDEDRILEQRSIALARRQKGCI